MKKYSANYLIGSSYCEPREFDSLEEAHKWVVKMRGHDDHSWGVQYFEMLKLDKLLENKSNG